MKLLTSLILLVGAISARECSPVPVSCTPVLAEPTNSEICSSAIASGGFKTSSCTSTVTASTPVSTKTTTVKSTSTSVVYTTSTRTIQRTFHRSTATAESVITVTSYDTEYSTLTDFSTTTDIDTETTIETSINVIPETTTVTTTDVDLTTVTVTETSFTRLGPTRLPPRLGRIMREKRAPLPSTCSCYLTSTVVTTSTPRASTTTSTISETTVKISTSTFKETITITYYGSTETDYVTTTVDSTVTLSKGTTVEVITETTSVSTITSVIPTTTTFTVTEGTRVTSTVTETATVIETIYPTPDTSCGNAGIQYAFFRHTFNNNDQPRYSSFNVQYFKSATPFQTGVTVRAGFVNTNWRNPYSIYGTEAIRTEYLAINHRGYLFARESGTYTFSVPTTDDITLFWIGAKAYAGYSRANADIEQPYVQAGGTAKTFTITLEIGEYYPLRILYGNGQEVASFGFTVTAPTGEVIISSTTTASRYLIQYSCDGVIAPQYLPWGSEV